MRSFVLAALGALALTTVATAGLAAQSGPKIAYINSQQIMAVAPGRAAAQAQLTQDMAGYRAQVKKMEDSLNAMVDSYNKVKSTLSPAVQATKEKAIRAKQQAYQQRYQDLQQEAQKHENELIQPIMAKIDSVIQEIRVEDGYAIVFDVGAQGGAVVAADSSLDITPKVIARLKADSASSKKQGAASKPGDTASGVEATPVGVTIPKKKRP
ncbi:MAG TPA: OmpH family outer membrane protein [Gemmatimonadaceae bacterium]|nr:OmpH family outer membrane protein [Gemmatimonadaceae bacterium]